MYNELIEYMKLHIISLEQDADRLQKKLDEFEGDLDSYEYEELVTTDIVNTGELIATRHLLSVAEGIMAK